MSDFATTQIQRKIDQQRTLLSGTDPIIRRRAEFETERLERELANAEAAAAYRAKIEKQREADRTQRDAAARVDLEAELIADYRASAPGTTEAEARVALPDLLHRHRLAEQDRLEAVTAETRRRIGRL